MIRSRRAGAPGRLADLGDAPMDRRLRLQTAHGAQPSKMILSARSRAQAIWWAERAVQVTTGPVARQAWTAGSSSRSRQTDRKSTQAVVKAGNCLDVRALRPRGMAGP